MVVKDSTGATITQNVPVTIDKTTQKITITVDNEKTEGNYVVEIVKKEQGTETALPGAVFNVNGEDKEATNSNGILSLGTVEITDTETLDTYTITETSSPEGYNKFEGSIELSVAKKLENGNYVVDTENTTMVVKDSTGATISQDVPVTINITTGRITIEVDNEKIVGDYGLEIVKVDSKTGEKLSGAVFNVNGEDKTVTNTNGVLNLGTIQITGTATKDSYIIKETTSPDTYNKFDGTIELDVAKKLENGKYVIDTANTTMTVKDSAGAEITQNIPVTIDKTTGKITITVENVKKEFDLALRKFIIAVSNDQTIEEDEYLRNEDGSYTREPVVDTSLLNTEDEEGNLITTAIYNHTKEPVLVQKNDIVIYMLRAYNEGDIDGYAAEIKDHLPPYLEYVDGEFNDQYGWEVSEDGRTVTTRYLENSLINKPVVNEDGKYELSYQEVPVMCRVIEGAPTNENITNIADITEYQDDNHEETTDRDSESDNVNLPSDEELPGYKDDETGEYIPGQEDDDDFEKVIVKEFDLALRKWVTEAIVIENGKETVTATGHQPYDDPEEIVKVELHRKKLNQVTVKFRYSIRVTNEGDIPGYVKEITDYIPEGLRFDPADNPGWTDEGNNIISTRLPQDILLQPGEYTEVEVVLTWINNQNNMGVMTNIAEISEDDNEYDLPDKDSTPDNQKEGEDDIDDAPVMISISTGAARTYFMLGGIVLVTLAGGVFLIKKFVI